jgi:outer membrane receptor protein involved in Fe transport
MKSKISQVKFPKKILTSFIGAVSLSILAHTAFAQIGSASVQGIIASHMLPQPGIEVIAKNVDNGYTFRTLTLKDGSYTFKGLAPGHYQIFLQDTAGKSPEAIVLKVGQSVSLDFEIDKPVTNNDKVDEVVIIGSQLKIKSVGGEIGTNVSLAQIKKLPQNTRNFLAFADLAPGVQFQQGQDGSTSIKGGAQSANAVNVFIDGVGQKNYVLKGGVTGQDSSRGNPFPQSAIGEYKVITQNYSAEYDQISSAAIIAVTASGTNEFHGGAFYDFSSEDYRKPTLSEIENKEKVPGNQKQYGFHVGGPIIQDTMHFFFAYEGKDNSDPKDVIAEGGYNASNLPAVLQAEIGGRAATFEEDLYFGKIDYLLSDEQKLELTTKIRREVELTNIGDANALSYGTDKKNDETRLDLSHNWRTDNWVNDIHLTSEDATYNPRPHTIGIGKRYNNDNNRTVLNVGAGPDFQEKSQKGWALQEDFTYLAISSHVIKTGFKFKAVDLVATEQQPYSPQFKYNVAYSLTDPFEVSWGAPLSTIGNGSAKTSNKQYGIYIQDDWVATARLNINVGVRWDYEESDGFLNYKTPSNVVSALQGWSNIQKSDINVNDYISTGNNRESFKNAWQPRVGFTYNLSDDNDLTLFGGVGRAYDRNLFDNLQVETTKATFPTYTRQFMNGDDSDFVCQAVGGSCVAWDPKYLTPEGLAQLASGIDGTGREVDLVNNKLRTPYSDQFSLGIRGSLNEYWRAEVSLSRIVSKDGFAWLLGNRRADGGFFEPGKNWGTPWGSGIPGFGSLLIGVNGIETKTNSLFFKLDKPKEESTWGASLAYTYSDGTTNRKSGEVYSFDYPSINAYGFHDANDLPNHRLVVTGIADLPLGIDFSAKLNLQTKESFYGTDCQAGPDECVYRTFKPNTIGTLGYRQLDIAFSKKFSTGKWVQGSDLTLRLDVLNLTNAVNHDNFEDFIGGYDADNNVPTPSPTFQKPTNKLAGPTRTMKFGITWDW